MAYKFLNLDNVLFHFTIDETYDLFDTEDSSKHFSVEIKTTDGHYFAFGNEKGLIDKPKQYIFAANIFSADFKYVQLIDETYEHFKKQNVINKLEE